LWKSIEKKFTEKEEVIRQKSQLKNDCESKSYEYKRRVDEDLQTYCEPAQRQKIKTYAEELVQWV